MLAATVLLPLAAQAVLASTFQVGDIFYATNQGDTIEEYHPNGSLVQTLIGGGTGVSAYLAFDSSGNLYVSQQGNVGKFSNNGTYLGTFATTAAGQWGGLAFNNAGDLFVGTANGSNTAGSGVFEFNSSGGLIKNYLPGTDVFGVALEANQNILLFTDETANVYALNLTTGVKSVFAVTGGANAGLTILSDGTVLVAGFTSNTVYRLDSAGNLLHTYSFAGVDPADVVADASDTAFWFTNYFNTSPYTVGEEELAGGNPAASFSGVGDRAAGIDIYGGIASSTSAPEPGTFALLGFAIAGLFIGRRLLTGERTASKP